MKLGLLLTAMLLTAATAGCVDSDAPAEDSVSPYTWGLGLPVADGFHATARGNVSDEERRLLAAAIERFVRPECPVEFPTLNLSRPGASTGGFIRYCSDASERAIDLAYGGAGRGPFDSYLVEAEAGYEELYARLAALEGTGHVMLDAFLGRFAYGVLSFSGFVETAKIYIDAYNGSGDVDHLDHAYLNILDARNHIANANRFLDIVEEDWPSCRSDFSLSLASLDALAGELEWVMVNTSHPDEWPPPEGHIRSQTVRHAHQVLDNEIGIAADVSRRSLEFRINYYEAFADLVLPTMGEAYHILNELAESAPFPGVVEYLSGATQVEPDVEQFWYKDPRLGMRVLAVQRMDHEPLARFCTG